jgi:hypothetical protein
MAIKCNRVKRARHVSDTGRKRNAYISVGKPNGNSPVGRPKRRWEDNIKINLK